MASDQLGVAPAARQQEFPQPLVPSCPVVLSLRSSPLARMAEDQHTCLLGLPRAQASAVLSLTVIVNGEAQVKSNIFLSKSFSENQIKTHDLVTNRYQYWLVTT